MKQTELKNSILNQFWQIYDNDGTIKALSWLETMKYYDEYCNDDISSITNAISKMST